MFLFFYGLAEAASGAVAGTALDQGSADLDLSYVADGINLQFMEDAAGRGLTWSAASSTTAARVGGKLNAAAVAALNGATQGTFVFKRGSSLSSDYFSTVFRLGATAAPRAMEYEINGSGLHAFRFQEQEVTFYNGSPYTIVVIDTTAETIQERVKVYGFDGTTRTQITPDGGYASQTFAQDTSIAGLIAGESDIVIGNRANQNANPAGTIKAVGWETVPLAPAALDLLLAAMHSDDDVMPATSPTLTFTSAPAIDQIAATTARLQLTTSLAASVKVIEDVAGSPEPDPSEFDAVSAVGTTTAYTVFQLPLTGLPPETSLRYHVQVSDGTTTLYASADVTTLALSNAILSINGGQPIREGQTGIVVTRESGATGTTATTLNGVAQANHTVNSDTASQFDWVWPNLLYGQGGTVNIDGVTAQSPPVLPPVGSSYVTLGAAYNPATPGAITAFPDAVAGDQIGYETQGGAVTIDELGRPTFTSAFNGSLVCWIIDSADGSRSANATIPYDAPADIIPTQFDLGADATNQEPGAYVVRSFVVAGVDAGADVPFNATGAAQVSDDNATWGNATTQQLGGTVYMRIPVPALGQPANVGGVSSGGVSDSISVAVRAAIVPTGITPAQPASVTQGAQASFTIAGSGIATVEWSVNGVVDPSQTGLTFTTTQTTPGNYTIGWVPRSAEGGAAAQGTTTLTVIAAATRIAIMAGLITGRGQPLAGSQNVPVNVRNADGSLRYSTVINYPLTGPYNLDSNQNPAVGVQCFYGFPSSIDGTEAMYPATVTAVS